MLAYVFTHRRAGGADISAYEEALRAFHVELARAAPRGFLGSTTFRVDDRYSDWYLVDGSAALDALNDAAVTGARKPAHDAAARSAGDGVGKLYSLAAGKPQFGPGVEIQFSKPRGMSYSEMGERILPFSNLPDTSLWRRMMVLGPPPEFCLVTPLAVELPSDFSPDVLRREPI